MNGDLISVKFGLSIVISCGLWTLQSSISMSNLPSIDLRFAEYISTLVVVEDIEITSWLVSAYDFYSRVVKDR